MEFLSELGLFVAKAAIVVVAIVAIIAAIGRAASRSPEDREGKIVVKKLNDRLDRMKRALDARLLPKPAAKRARRAAEAERKARRKAKGEALEAMLARPRVFVLTFDGNLRATATDDLREEISAILAVARDGDEVVVKLKSPGGMVHAYGFAASQLERVRERGLRLTAAVDLVAASGGYMMAAVADRILAAPFAVVGSIGVMAGIPNFHRFLKRRDIDFELLTAGEDKRSLTLFGENTEADRRKLQGEIEDVHALFKAHVQRLRPGVDIERVATGKSWYAAQALELGLVDELITSDEYLLRRAGEADVLSVAHRVKAPLLDRVGRTVETTVARSVDRMLERALEDRHR